MPHTISYLRRLYVIILLIVALSLFAACGGGSSSDSSATGSTDVAPAAPTMPSGQFVAVGEQSGLTKTVSLTETTATTATTETAGPAPDLARGEAAYVKNKCGDCHGAAGEGVADKGSAITEMSLTLAEFDKLLRTGNGLGNTHIFGRSAVSPSGMESLYAYTQSLE